MYREYFKKQFEEIEDTRYRWFVEYKLVDILILVMCGVLCGLDELRDIATFGKEKQAFLRKSFEIEKTPSRSTLTRVMNMIDGEKMAACIVNIMRSLMGIEGEVIAFDGKTICATAKNNREKLHIITAYLTKSGVVLGQKAVGDKTNEIPVMQEMLAALDLKDRVVTADAMHCQKETSRIVIEGGGNYIWGLKGNQETLRSETALYLDDCISSEEPEIEVATSTEKNGGRIETRTCCKSGNIEWFEDRSDWAGLQSVFAIDRTFKTQNKTSYERSYYITSLDVSAEELLSLVREHWLVESMHWQLDVTFAEDDTKILSSNGLKSMNAFRKLALALHKHYISLISSKAKPSIRNNMLQSLLSSDTLSKVIAASFTVS